MNIFRMYITSPKLVKNFSGTTHILIAQETATIIGAIGQGLIVYLAMKQGNTIQDKIHQENKEFRQEGREYNRINNFISNLSNLKTSLNSTLYGTNHREVSDGMAQILSKYEQQEFRKFIKDNQDLTLNYQDEKKFINKDKKILTLTERKIIAENWYSKYIEFGKQNNSLDEKRKNSEYQINMYRSASRDNFIAIYSILEEYKRLLESIQDNTENSAQDRKKITQSMIDEYGYKIPELISTGQAKELLHRYYRFVRYVYPIDKRMGYTDNDGEIYKHDIFTKALSDCIQDKNALNNTYNDLEFEKLDQ